MAWASSTCRVSLDLTDTQQGREWRLGGTGAATFPGEPHPCRDGQPCSARERLAQGMFRSRSSRQGVRNPRRPRRVTAPTQLSHPVTSTFHLQNRTVSRPTCNTKARGRRSRPTWESFTGTPGETCESAPVTLWSCP